MQEALGRLNAMLFNYVGALQRDAPPQPLKQEPLVAPPKTYDVQVGAPVRPGLVPGLRLLGYPQPEVPFKLLMDSCEA